MSQNKYFNRSYLANDKSHSFGIWNVGYLDAIRSTYLEIVAKIEQPEIHVYFKIFDNF